MTGSEQGKKPGMFGRLFGSGAAPKPTEQEDAPGDAAGLEDQAAKHPEASDEMRDVSEAPDEAKSSDLPPENPEPEAHGAAPEAAVGEPDTEQQTKTSWFTRLTSGLSKTSGRLSDGITGLFTKKKIDAETLEDFEDLLIQSDLGVATAMRITEKLSKSRVGKDLTPDQVREVLSSEIARVLEPVARPLSVDAAHKPHVILMVGVNGSGKTTTIGKLASKFTSEGHKVMLAAGDTFRAAAIDQLKVWGERTGCEVVARSVGSDSSGLAYDAMKSARDTGQDILLVDTAGRLQNKNVLMEELEKVVRVMRKVDPSAPHDVILVLDATTGQNALQQVEVFKSRAAVSGLIMTKLDGTARGGILVAISEKYGLPVHAIGVGESVDDLQPFEPSDFAKAIAAN